MDRYDPFAGGMFLVCAEAVSAPFENGRGGSIKIYVTDLSLYNAGILHGEWIELPCDKTELDKKCNEISSCR